MTEEEYKSKVSTAKDTVAKMIEFGEQNNIGAGELENDIETYLEEQGLTFFDLKTDGNRREASYTTAFTNAFNNRLNEILQVVVPEIAVSLTSPTRFGTLDVNEMIEKEEHCSYALAQKNLDALSWKSQAQKLTQCYSDLLDEKRL